MGSLRRLAVAFLPAVLALVLAPASGARITAPEARLVTLINVIRARHLAPPLHLDPRLDKAAHAHSRDMIRRGYFGHGDFATRLSGFGVRSPLIGENLAWTSGRTISPQEIAGMWLRSPKHRRVLLLSGFHRVGIALPVGPFEGYRAAVVATADFSA